MTPTKIYTSANGYDTVIEVDGKTYVTYWGDTREWLEYPSGKRCSTQLDVELCELWNGHVMRERGAP